MRHLFLTAISIPLISLSQAQLQQPLSSHSHSPPNFISNSIFRPLLSTSSIPHPETLPPTYHILQSAANDLYQGINTFAHLPFIECMDSKNSGKFDIGIVGHPFDLGVSYRPGARFGPNGARQGARRMSTGAGWECVSLFLKLDLKILLSFLSSILTDINLHFCFHFYF